MQMANRNNEYGKLNFQTVADPKGGADGAVLMM
jgi:hypothetical protein